MQDEEKIISLLRDEAAPPLGDAAAKRIAANAAAEFIRTKPGRASLFGALRIRANGMRRIPLMAGSFAAAALAAFAFVWQFAHQPSGVMLPKDAIERQRVLLAQFNELFGGKLQAVVTVNGQTQIILGETGTARGAPVVIRLNAEGQKIDILSFSGETVKVSVGGREVSFDALEDGRGGVILAGEKLLWTSRKGAAQHAPGMKIKAQLLEM